MRVERYCLGFAYDDDPGAGFSFDCDKDGNIDVAAMNPAARENYEACLSGFAQGEAVHATGVADFSYTYTGPLILGCSCGREVALDGFTNTCECGRDYNSSGMLLASRSQWGEETGETLGDILRIR